MSLIEIDFGEHVKQLWLQFSSWIGNYSKDVRRRFFFCHLCHLCHVFAQLYVGVYFVSDKTGGWLAVGFGRRMKERLSLAIISGRVTDFSLTSSEI